MSTPPTPPSVPPFLLNHLNTLSDPPLPENFIPFMQSALSPPNPESLCDLITFLYTNTLPLPTARHIHAELCASLLPLPSDAFTPVAKHLFRNHDLPTNSRAFAFEPALIPIRDRYSADLEAAQQYKLAADALAVIPFDTLPALLEPSLLRYNLRIARLFIMAGVVDTADVYINRATAQLVTYDHPDLRMQHRICQARILDAKRRFEDAATKYYALSQHPPSPFLQPSTKAFLAPALLHAVTCAILAPAGPRRSRVLAILYNDERSRSLELFPLLQSIHMGRLLQKEQIARFLPTLQPHQLATHPDGDTVLDRAVMEHNLLAVSRLYTNIAFEELGQLLSVSPVKAETTAARMIYENRMKASIDQVDAILQFSPNPPGLQIDQWDAHIATICSAVDDCVESIIDKYPQFASLLES